MRTFKKAFLPLLGMGLLASCSNDNVDQPNAGIADVMGDGTYMNISISIPSLNSTRAVEYKDGLESEFALEDGYVYLFNAAGNCVARGNLPVDDLRKNGNDDITGTINFYKIKVDSNFEKKDQDDFNTTGNYNALVILNTSGVNTPSEGSTWSAWATSNDEKGMKYVKEGKTYFTMTNALGWSGEDTEVTAPIPNVLVPITADNLYHNADDAYKVKPVEFFVQRGVAKVTLNQTGLHINSANVGEDVSSYTYDNVKGTEKDGVALLAWDLDITNKTTYPVQTIDASKFTYIVDWSALTDKAPQRFIGGNGAFNRIFWATDANYDAGSNSNFNNLYTSATSYTQPATVKDGDDNPLYCLENTFNLDNQNKNVSTRIVFKANYKANGTAGTFVKYGTNYVNLPAVNSPYPSLKKTVSGTYTLSELFESNESSKYAKIQEDLKATPNTKVDFYVNGDCYYSVIIRHFENEELLKTSDDWNWSNWYFRGSYGNDNDHYLGRYGVVRNNWYDVKINQISGPGTPTVPEPKDEPDDDPDPFKLDVTINILSWAKRSHSYDL